MKKCDSVRIVASIYMKIRHTLIAVPVISALAAGLVVGAIALTGLYHLGVRLIGERALSICQTQAADCDPVRLKALSRSKDSRPILIIWNFMTAL